MTYEKPSALRFWLAHGLGLLLALPLTAWWLSSMDRGAFLTEPYLFIVQMLLIALLPVKAPALIAQYLYYRSAFWYRSDRILRCALSYLLDLFLSVLCGILTMPFWIPLFFTSASYPLFFAFFPHVLLVAGVLSWLAPVREKPAQQAENDIEASLLLAPEKLLPATHVLLVVLSLLASALAAGLAGMQSLNFLGLMIGLFPLFVPVFLIYLLPGYLALHRRSPQSLPVLLVTLLLGWTVFIWVLCLLWALFTKGGGNTLKLISWRITGVYILMTLGLLFLGVGLSMVWEILEGTNAAVEDTSMGPAVLLFIISTAFLLGGVKVAFPLWRKTAKAQTS